MLVTRSLQVPALYLHLHFHNIRYTNKICKQQICSQTQSIAQIYCQFLGFSLLAAPESPVPAGSSLGKGLIVQNCKSNMTKGASRCQGGMGGLFTNSNKMVRIFY